MEQLRVIEVNRQFCRLLGAGGELLVTCPPKLAPALVGDWATLDPTGSRIARIAPRHGVLARKKAGPARERQFMAANVDVLFDIVMGLDGDFNPRRLERYQWLAAECGVRPVVVLNKSDLCAGPRAVAGEAPVVRITALDPASAAQLHHHVASGETAALLGSSGAGKSTIANTLLEGGRQLTRAVREHDSRGRHTTTARHLFLTAGGWWLLDTPGMRELEVWDASAHTLDSTFADIEALAAECRFRDCRHNGEPGCAVVSQVDARRLAGFRKLQARFNE